MVNTEIILISVWTIAGIFQQKPFKNNRLQIHCSRKNNFVSSNVLKTCDKNINSKGRYDKVKIVEPKKVFFN